MDYRVSELSEQVTTARANYRSVVIVGGGTKKFYGNPRRKTDENAHLLDMRGLTGVIHYEPSELVVTAWAGTTLQAVETLLAEHGQMLAFDPPNFGPGATLGGAVASGLSGPASFGYGPLRHFVLGTQLLDAQGRILKFGGEVMKNVAGYDVSRLLAGSMGMFGALVTISIKVMPKPTTDLTYVLPLSESDALALSRKFRASTWPIKAAAWMQEPAIAGLDNGPALVIRLAGSQASVSQAQQVLGGEVLAPSVAAQWWQSFKEQSHLFFAGGPIWRLAVRQGTPALGLGLTCFDWGGELRWVRTDAPAAVVRAAAESAGGHATLFRQSADIEIPSDGVFHPLAPGIYTVVRHLKDEFDPKRIFNPGRLVLDL